MSGWLRVESTERSTNVNATTNRGRGGEQIEIEDPLLPQQVLTSLRNWRWDGAFIQQHRHSKVTLKLLEFEFRAMGRLASANFEADTYA